MPLGKGTFLVHGKGQKVVVMDIAIQSLKDDLNLELLSREPNEYLLYPRQRTTDPMDHASLHRWFKKALRRAGLPESIKMHELRHVASSVRRHDSGLPAPDTREPQRGSGIAASGAVIVKSCVWLSRYRAPLNGSVP